jgi:DNA-binding transcriptional regulator YiaG
MFDHECYEEGCGARLELKRHTQTTRVGRYRVLDSSTMVPVCSNGHPELTLANLMEFDRRAAAVVFREAPELGGEEIRVARKALGLTQVELASRLDVRQETVSRWERNHETISMVSRLAILALLLPPGDKPTPSRDPNVFTIGGKAA